MRNSLSGCEVFLGMLLGYILGLLNLRVIFIIIIVIVLIGVTRWLIYFLFSRELNDCICYGLAY